MAARSSRLPVTTPEGSRGTTIALQIANTMVRPSTDLAISSGAASHLGKWSRASARTPTAAIAVRVMARLIHTACRHPRRRTRLTCVGAYSIALDVKAVAELLRQDDRGAQHRLNNEVQTPRGIEYVPVLAVGAEDRPQTEHQQQHGQAECCTINHLFVGGNPVRGSSTSAPSEDRIGDRQDQQGQECADEDDDRVTCLTLALVIGVVIERKEYRDEREAREEARYGGVPARG